MKMLIISDIHGNLEMLYRVAKQHSDADGVIFLGDGFSEIERFAQEYPHWSLHTVCGNCDYPEQFPTERVLTLGEHKIFFTHGHSYGVKAGTKGLIRRAKEEGASVVLFGHTHSPLHMKEEGVVLFNPGTLSFSNPHYGILTEQNGELTLESLSAESV